MALSVIRAATQPDYDAVRASAERFCGRHSISVYRAYNPILDALDTDAESAIEHAADMAGNTRLRRLWQACYCRALGERYDYRMTIGYGYVGLAVE